MVTKNFMRLGVAVGALMQAVPAVAQETSEGQQGEQSNNEATATDLAGQGTSEVATGNLIVVTARRRQETLQNVPVVAQAFSQDSLDQFGTDNISDLTSRVPDLLAGEAVNATGTQLSLRGVGTTALNATIDQSISLNIDGLPLTQGLAYNVGFFDLGTLEVLKGPQALFFGKNSPAGVISLRSADPTDEFEGMVRLGYEFSAEEKVVEAVLSGPVSDSLRMRLAGRFSDMEGHFNNTAQAIPGLGTLNPTDRTFPNAQSVIVRGTVLFDPSPAYSARLKLNYSHFDEDGSATPLDVKFCPDGTGPVAPTNIPFIAGNDCKLDGNIALPIPDPAAFPTARNGALYFYTSEQYFGSLEQTLRLSEDVDITSLTTFYHVDQSTIHNASTTSNVVVIIQDNDFYNDQFTQEFRLQTDFRDSPVNFLLGAFYQDAQIMNHVRVPANQALGFLPPVLLSPRHLVDIKSVSTFGQAAWDITPALEFTAGARWTSEERRHRQFNHLLPGNPQTDLLVPRIDSANVSPELTLAYRPTSNLTIFGSYKWGFKSGSFNSATFINPTTNASFNDEKVEGAEIGVKSQLMQGALTLNLSAYRYLYDDMQVGALELQRLPGGTLAFALRTINAAAAKVQGVEVQANYTPPGVPGLDLYAVANYNNARYTSFPNAPCGNGQPASAGCDNLLNPITGRFSAQDLSGRRLVRAPDFVASAGFDYDHGFSNGWTLALGANANYSSEYSTTLVDLPGFEQDAFAKFGANVALRGPDERWELALIGNNLFNEYTTALCFNTNLQNATVLGGQISGGTTLGPAGRDEAACAVDRGRQVTARATYRF